MAGSPEDRYPELPDGTPAPLRPSDVRPLVDADVHHILDGDGLGSGGHQAGSGIVGKEELPAGWGDATVREAIEAALWGADVPRNLSPDPAGVRLRAIYDDVVLEVPINDFGTYWEAATAYPLSGDGVYKNIAPGQRVAIPLNINDFTRRLDD